MCLPKGTSTSTLETKVDDRSVETERDYDRNYADGRVEELLNKNLSEHSCQIDISPGLRQEFRRSLCCRAGRVTE